MVEMIRFFGMRFKKVNNKMENVPGNLRVEEFPEWFKQITITIVILRLTSATISRCSMAIIQRKHENELSFRRILGNDNISSFSRRNTKESGPSLSAKPGSSMQIAMTGTASVDPLPISLCVQHIESALSPSTCDPRENGTPTQSALQDWDAIR
jgi:hypothetical protein